MHKSERVLENGNLWTLLDIMIESEHLVETKQT